jgi:hypothetical protein
MLPFFRKNIKIFIWVIVFSFAAWGAGSIAISRDKSASYAGKVFGEKISHKEYLAMFRFFDLMTQNQERKKQEAQTSSQAESNGNEEPAKNTTAETKDSPTTPPAPPEAPNFDRLRMLAWQTIILSREAKREGVTVTDDEVADEIQMLFAGGNNFNPEFYRMWVEKQFRTKPRDFEETIRKYLASQKVRDHILNTAPEKEKDKKLMEWLVSVMSRAKLEDYTQKTEAE